MEVVCLSILRACFLFDWGTSQCPAVPSRNTGFTLHSVPVGALLQQTLSVVSECSSYDSVTVGDPTLLPVCGGGGQKVTDGLSL